MALSNAERQARLRERRRFSGGMTQEPGQERLDTWLSSDRKFELEVLAALKGATIRETLENLIWSEALCVEKDEWENAVKTVLDRRRGND